MSYQTNRTNFVRAKCGSKLNYTGVKPVDESELALALIISDNGETVITTNNEGVEQVMFSQCFKEGDVYTYVPVGNINKQVKLFIDDNKTKFALFVVQNSVVINRSNAKETVL